MKDATDFDKDAFIDEIELALDYGFPISDEDLERYRQEILKN